MGLVRVGVLCSKQKACWYKAPTDGHCSMKAKTLPWIYNIFPNATFGLIYISWDQASHDFAMQHKYFETAEYVATNLLLDKRALLEYM